MHDKLHLDDPSVDADCNVRFLGDNPGMVNRDECIFKKCCKKYKRKGRHCRKCPKLD